MALWNFDPTQYTEKTFELIPVGDHRAKIKEVVLRDGDTAFNSGNSGYEITMAISGYTSTVKHYLVLNPADPARTNQAIGAFFDSFGIAERQLGNGQAWVGKAGAVRIRHEEYNGENRAKIAYCIAKSRQAKLPDWKEVGGVASAKPAVPGIDMGDLPF